MTDWIIWNELVKSNYNIKCIEMLITSVYIDIQISFENYNSIEHFSLKIFKQINQRLNTNVNNNLLQLCLHKINDDNPVNLFENLNYPQNVHRIIIMVDSLSSKIFLSNTNCFKLFNLPEQLEELKIISSIPFDLSKLPTKIFLLDILNSKCKFNLDYLPDSIKIIYLSELLNFFDMTQEDNEYQYKLSDLINLPSSLIEINIGHPCKNIVYSSVQKLIKNFEKDINLLVENKS